MTPPETPTFDSPLRSITVQIPTAVAHKLSETFDGTLEDAALAGLKLLNGLGPVAYNTLLTLAKRHDITPAKALRTAIDLLQADSEVPDRKLPHKPTAGRPKINEARDAEIYAQLKSGLTHAVVAKAFDISLVRIGQIAAQQRLIQGDRPRGRVAPRPAAEPVQPKQTPPQPTQEVLSLNDSAPTKPKVLAVIPPSMRNPELFRSAEERPQPVPADKLNMDIFQDDYPLEQVFDLRGVEPGRVAYTNTPIAKK